VEIKREDRQPQRRLMSLDALRGFDMFWIIGGGTILKILDGALSNEYYHNVIVPQFSHVRWEGFRFWDLIMPLFLFVVGVAMPFSFGKRLSHDDRKSKLYGHILKRFFILFILGMVAQGGLLKYDLSKLHLFCNTLQAIAAGYLFASLIILNMRAIGQIVVTIVLLLGYWALLGLVAVPGHERGLITENVNLAMYVDKLILGHFQHVTDPQYTWILSSMTFTATVMLGCLAGQLLRSEAGDYARVLWLLVAGAACLGLGLLWGAVFPIIKHLWTSSFVLFAGGICYFLLAVFYLIIDVWNLRKWAIFFVVIGMNAIAVYMAVHIFGFRTFGEPFVRGLEGKVGNWYEFSRALVSFLVLWLILFWMYRKKAFIKI